MKRRFPVRRTATLLLLFLSASLWMWGSRAVAAEELPTVGTERIVLHTVAGDIVLALYPDVAPKTVAQVLRLARLGVYDTMHFARVDPFLVQMGEVRDRRAPLSAEQKTALDRIPGEFSRVVKHQAGMLSMVRGDDQNSADGAFAIVRRDAPDLDGQHTIFGRVEQGIEVVEALGTMRTDSLNRPLVRLAVDKAEVVDSANALSRLRVRGVIPIDDPLEVRPAMQPLVNALTACVVVIALISLGSFLVLDRLSSRHRRSLSLIQIMIAVFMIFMLQAPVAQQAPVLGAVLFAALVGLFKLMSRFES